jgi:hypothetical protein
VIRILRTALHHLVRKPLRGIMTLLSFSLSAAILAVLACLVFQINDYIESNILGSGTRVWISTFTGRNAGEAQTFYNLSTGQLTDLKNRAGLQLVSPIWDGGWRLARVDGAKYVSHVGVMGTWPDYAKICGLRMVAGSFFTEQEAADKVDVAVVSESLAKIIWGTPAAAIGKTLTPEGLDERDIIAFSDQYRVIGVFADLEGLKNMFLQVASVLVPYRFISAVGSSGMVVYNAAAWTPSRGFQRVERRIQDVLMSGWKNKDAVSIWQGSMYDQYGTMVSGMLRRMQVAGAIFAALGMMALLVLGFGVLGFTMIDVADSARDIGLRRALGVSRRGVVAELVAESGMLVLLSGVLGSVAAWFLAGQALAAVKPLLAAGGDVTEIVLRDATTLKAVLVGFVALLAAGIGASIYPAVQAVRVPPAESLREL